MAAGTGTSSHALERGCRFFVAMRCQIIEHDHRARCNFGHQHLADVDGEGGRIHCALDGPRRNQGFVRQACNQRLRSPDSKRGVHRQARAA